MERYSGNQAMEAGPVDPEADWAEYGGETGLQEPMWRLGLGGGPESYPERPDKPDCIYYLRTGFCGYGNRCRFNHPHDRSTAIGALRAGGVEYPERAGQPICQYYTRTGICKFEASCKYHHPKHGAAESSAPVALNFYGYPLRLGEKECSYYVKTRECKFGVTCKFHHPQPAEIQMPASTPGTGHLSGPVVGPTHAIYQTTLQSPVQSSQQYGVIPGNWAAARPAMVSGSYVPTGSYGPMLFSQGVLPVPGWTPYPEYGVHASVGPAANGSTQPTVGAGPMYGLTQAYTGPYLSSTGPSSTSQKENVFPERPGQPECQYYLRTGNCKFGSTCKYHHPPEWSVPKTNFMLTPMGLPLRPGAPLCAHYAQSGLCRFGSSCKFDHPMRSSMSYSSSTSSLTDMTIAPYPIGSTNTTLAPSSSSSDLRPGFIKDSFSSHMSSMNSSSASVSSVFSTSFESSAQQSGQGSISSTGGEIHTSS